MVRRSAFWPIHARAVIIPVLDPNPGSELSCFMTSSIPIPTPAKIRILIAVIVTGPESGFGIKVVF